MEEITLRKLAAGVRHTHKAENARQVVLKEETAERLGKYARQAVKGRYFKVAFTKPPKPV